MKILVTGAAGFIGFHLANRYLQAGFEIVGLDNLNDYYDVNLKRGRLDLLFAHDRFQFERLELADSSQIEELFARHRFDRVVHLAAQAGVRYSIDNPSAYVDSNLLGFANILEACRNSACPHLIYASSSSVYGSNKKYPFAIEDPVDHPVSLYAATKKANELMAHTYSHLYRIPTTGLRFFTVYGPWGRPDMAYYKFALKMKAGEPIDIYNSGQMQRDFTYIDDIVEGIVRVAERIPEEGDCPESGAPYSLFNIGNHNPVALMEFVEQLEQALGVEATKKFLPMQPGDVEVTYADTTELREKVGFAPSTPLSTGLARFASWFDEYHGR